MLNYRNQWCLLTTYKENYSLLSPLVLFYRHFYGVRHFLILCSLTGARTHDSLKKLIGSKVGAVAAPIDKVHVTHLKRELTVSEFVSGNFVLWAVSHPGRDFIPEVEFHDLKVELHRWADSFLPREITRTLVVDNDEFLYVKSPRVLESAEHLGFHFVDVIPATTWPPRELWFSLQGWYYARQVNPRFRYGGSLMISLARAFGRGLNHDGCKTFYFDRARLSDYTAWHHGTTGSLCSCFALNRCLAEPERCRDILRGTACCYHLAMTSREHFLLEKLRLFNRLQTDGNKRPAHDTRSPATTDPRLAMKAFDRFIKESWFPTIRDDFLLPYLNDTLPQDGGQQVG
jgi:hypothetical protein